MNYGEEWINTAKSLKRGTPKLLIFTEKLGFPGGTSDKEPPPTLPLPMQEMPETQVRSLGWKDLLEKEMVTHSDILAWRIPWTEEPGRLQSMGLQRVRHD